jgi:hypothetical protein
MRLAVASDLTRARAVWRYAGRGFVVGLVTLAPLLVLLDILEELQMRL